jgi:hypothetical protein
MVGVVGIRVGTDNFSGVVDADGLCVGGMREPDVGERAAGVAEPRRFPAVSSYVPMIVPAVLMPVPVLSVEFGTVRARYTPPLNVKAVDLYGLFGSMR